MRSGLLSDLAVIGYEIFLEGDNVKFRYQKPGDPPIAVRPLIDELRKCKAEVVNILKTGTTAITPSEIVEPGATVGAIWVNPHKQGTQEARRESLMQYMDATWQEVHMSVREAYEGKQRQFKATPNILILEQRIEVLQQAVLKGEAKLKDFRLTALEWQQAAKAELN